MTDNCPCCGRCEGYGCTCEDWLLVKFWKSKCLALQEQVNPTTDNTALVEALLNPPMIEHVIGRNTPDEDVWRSNMRLAAEALSRAPQPAPDEVAERARFEHWMVNTAKIVVGSHDPYPAGLEQSYWQVWQAALASQDKEAQGCAT